MAWFAPEHIDPPRAPNGTFLGPPPLTLRLMLGLFGAVLGSFVSNLDTRLTTFSLADLRGGIGYGVDEAAWVSAAYNIAEIAVVPMTPWLAGIISQRRAVAAAITLVSIAGALCPWAANQGYVWLLTMRFLQGLGGGALIPLLLGILLRHMPLYQRIYGLTLYALVTASTPLISESLAGLLTDIVHWQSVFYIGGAIGPIVLGLVLYGLPVDPYRPEVFRTTDYAGMFLMALSASFLTAALDEGQRLDWFSSPFIVSLSAAGAVTLVAFIAVELYQKAPLINLRLLLRRNFSGGLLTIFAFSVSIMGTSLLLPQYGIEVRGFRELQVGNILIWAALAQLFVFAAAPILLRVLEVRIVLALGLLTVAMGARLATFADSDWVRPDILPSHILQACGQPLIILSLVVISTSTLQPVDALSGATTFNVVRTLAGTIAGAVIGGILTVRERVHSNTIVEHLATGAATTVQAQAAGGLVGAVRRQATTMAVADAFGWMGVIILAFMLVVIMLNETKLIRAPRSSVK
jgi:MFS transporter, DHA2 family, multidrug resistance protein